MISAKEAVELVILSSQELDKVLNKISDKIIEKSNDGKRTLNLTQEIDRDLFAVVRVSLYKSIELTTYQQRIRTSLKNAGYRFSIEEHTYDLTKTFGYMADGDNDGPIMQTDYTIQIGW